MPSMACYGIVSERVSPFHAIFLAFLCVSPYIYVMWQGDIYVPTICRCGCREKFLARQKWARDGSGLHVPRYKRGHHPNCRKNQTGKKPAWNKGKKKGDHPSLAHMGFQYGNKHWNWQEDLNPNWFS